MHVEYEQCKVTERHEFQTGVFRDTCMFCSFLPFTSIQRCRRVTLKGGVAVVTSSGQDRMPIPFFQSTEMLGIPNSAILWLGVCEHTVP